MLFIDPHTDLLNTLTFINDLSKEMGIKDLSIDAQKIQAIIAGAVSDGDYTAATASPFRKLASFVSYFISMKPISTPSLIQRFHKIDNHQNAIFALEIAIASLHGARIHRAPEKGGDFVLANRIELSDHSYFDIIDAIAWVTPQSGKKLVAVLLEQMCYRKNPACEYVNGS